ncbi:hypothetical protein [Stackebrandtia soli]|uniref:hypothetical protein n=1 Tax=Stackebrandtia soli TaxID=1892856 RepID=UPI0039ED00A7
MSRSNNELFALLAMVENSQFTDVKRVAVGLGENFADALPSCRHLPEHLIEAVLDCGDRGLLAKLLGNTAVTLRPESARPLLDAAFANLDGVVVDAIMGNSHLGGRRDVRERLAATGHARVLERTCIPYTSNDWDLRLRRMVMAASTEDFSVRMRQINRDLERLRAAVVSPVPAMVREAILKLGTGLTTAEQLLAARSLAENDGGIAALSTLDVSCLRPNVAKLLNEITTDGELGRLDDAIAVAEGDEGLLEELYDTKLTGHAELLELHEPLNWDVLVAAGRRKPFTKGASHVLVKRDDCPDELRDLLFTRHPSVVIENAARLDAALLIQPCPKRSRAKATRELIVDELGRRISATEALRQGRPAMAVLESVPPRESHSDAHKAAAGEFSEMVAELVSKHLGTELRPWRAVRELLPHFDGTVPELLEAAASASETPSGAFPSRPREGLDNFEPTRADKAFVALLDVADSAAHAAMFPHMSYMTRLDLLNHCRWRPEWIDMVLASDDPDAELWYVGGGVLDVEAIDRFTRLTPGLLRELLTQPASTEAQRKSWLRNTDVVRQAVQYTGPQHWRITDLRHCDAQLVTDHIGRKVRYLFKATQGRIPQLKLFLDVWKAHGPETVFDLLPYEPLTFESYQEARRTLEELLERTDVDGALRELQNIVDNGGTAEFQIQSWRTRTDRAGLADEDHDWHWDALLSAHRREPFHHDAVWRMAQLAYCPQELKAEASAILPSRLHRAYTQLMTDTKVSTVFKNNPADDVDRNLDEWIPVAIAAGKLSWAQALQHAHPARPVLAQLKVKGADEGRAALAALMSQTIGDDPDAWILAVRMLPDFTGTVTELLTTAAAATG